jgi:hypothetical protein
MPDLPAIETHVGFICTIIMAIAAVWQIRPRATPAVPDSTNSTVRTSAKILSWPSFRASVLALLALGIGAFTFYSIPSSVRGQQGVPGPPGPQGRAGPPGPSMPDSRIDSIVGRVVALENRLGSISPQQDQDRQQLRQVIVASAQLSWLESESEQFKNAGDQYKQEFGNVINEYLVPPTQPAIPHMGMMSDTSMYPLMAKQMKDMVSADFHETIDLEKHPNFDQEPYNHVPGDDKIPDEDNKLKYRRMYDQFQTAKNTILLYTSKYQQAIAVCRTQITRFGASSFRAEPHS